MTSPALDARDHAAVVDHVIRTGQAVIELNDVPDEFVAWRSALRRAARARGSRLTVLRPASSGRVFVLDPDYVTTEIEGRAIMSGLDRAMRGEPHVPLSVAVDQERRSRSRRSRRKHAELAQAAQPAAGVIP